MKVLLIRPNSPLVVTPVPVGLGAISFALKKKGHETRIIDARRERLYPETVMSMAARFGPDAIGVTSMTYEAPEALALIEMFKDRAPEIPVILGGPHATGFGPDLLESSSADYLVLGEGERTAVSLMDVIENGADPNEVAGIAFRKDGAVVSTGPPDPIGIEEIGTDWDSVSPERYFGYWTRNAMNTIARSARRLPIFTSRGCPFGCAYCHHIFGRKYRAHHPARVAAEIKELSARYDVREFEIIDDNFNLKLDHAKAVMEEVIKLDLGLHLAFTNGLRADRMDEELLGLMKRAGTYRVDYAVESASQRVQKLCKKDLDLGRAREVIDMTARSGIVTGAYYMLGFPGETEEEMEATVDYALSLTNHIASFFYLMPFPGTELAEADPEVGRKVREMRFRDASGIALNLSAVPDETMQRIRKRAYRDFYFSGRRLARIVSDVPKNARLAASGLAVLRLSFQEAVNY